MSRDGVFLPMQAQAAPPSTEPACPLDQDEEKAALEPSQRAADGDPFAPLAHFDTVFPIDGSAAMRPYWDEVYRVLSAVFAVCCEQDPNGGDSPSHRAGVQLFQAGRDPRARARMQAEDNRFKAAKTRDMVDTVARSGPARVRSAEGVLKAVLGAVQKSIPSRRSGCWFQNPRRQTQLNNTVAR